MVFGWLTTLSSVVLDSDQPKAIMRKHLWQCYTVKDRQVTYNLSQIIIQIPLILAQSDDGSGLAICTKAAQFIWSPILVFDDGRKRCSFFFLIVLDVTVWGIKLETIKAIFQTPASKPRMKFYLQEGREIVYLKFIK